MGTKLNPGDFDCYDNALPDEPMFILLGRDPAAPVLVRAWAEKRAHLIDHGARPQEDRAMVVEALQCARSMEEWRKANDGKWRRVTSRRSDAGERERLAKWVVSEPCSVCGGDCASANPPVTFCPAKERAKIASLLRGGPRPPAA